MATNLELKVRATPDELERVAARANALDASTQDAMRQVDTYFHVRHGRLKLREITSEGQAVSYELIGYQRPDNDAARWSTYSRAPLDPNVAPSVLEALRSTLGVKIVVEKQRRVAIWRRTRIHLDLVAGLGAFVELETVTTTDDDPTAYEELAALASSLGLDALDRVPGSYADLLLEGETSCD